MSHPPTVSIPFVEDSERGPATTAWSSVRQLIEQHALVAHFQPIVDLPDARVHGHEALVRTPAGCAWPNPDALFAAARAEGVAIALELECLRSALRCWSRSPMGGRLFVNLSASALLQMLREHGLESAAALMQARGVAASSVVVELTEHEHVRDVAALVDAATQLRRHGVAVALDDFGDGRSSLRLWSELRPEVVKIDKYFINDLTRQGNKLQTLRALLHIAETFGTRLVAEGIETLDDLRVVRDLGIRFGQGWALGRPQAEALSTVPEQALGVLASRDIAVLPELRRVSDHQMTAGRLLRQVDPLLACATHEEALDRFQREPATHALAIVDGERPIGLLSRETFISSYARPYFKELFNRRPALMHANTTPLLLDVHTGVDELVAVLTASDQRYLVDGFIITEGGRYLGLGTGEQLVRTVTEARIEAARHANPLTFLPGNIPLTHHIERLLRSGREFAAAYADLNQFKPFNDQYGYWRGDEMIRLLARVVVSHCDSRRDFVGHVGGDDFVLLFQSEDWYVRCGRIVEAFNHMALGLFDEAAVAAGGIHAEDRHGVMRFHPCTTLSIGILRVNGERMRSAEEVASAAAAAKRVAKARGDGLHVLDAPPWQPAPITPA